MTDEIEDRLSRRFNDSEDQDTEEDASTDNSQTDMSSTQSQTDKNKQRSQNAQNIKKAWNVRSFYLDDELNSELTTAFKRLDLEISEADADINLKKTRHFYPLIVQLGLERLDEMDLTEVTEQLERTD